MSGDPWGDEYPSYFTGDCTCAHTPEEHTWGQCGEDDCDCTAGWEE